MPRRRRTAAPQPRASSVTARSGVGAWLDRRGWLIVVAVAMLAFLPSLSNQLSYDETLVIERADPFLRSGRLGVLFSKSYFAASREGTYRPVVTLTYMADRALGSSPWIPKGQSLGWHIGVALLVIAFARRVLPAPHRRFAWLAGLFFAIHPVVSEAVDNASFREDNLATFFGLAAMLLALRGRRVLALGAYALALLSKESAIVVPLLLLGVRLALDDVDAPKPSRRAVWIEAALFAALTLAYLVLRFGPMKTPVPYGEVHGGSRAAALLGMLAVFAYDLRLLLVPWPLCADYSGFFPFGVVTVGVVAGLVALIGYVLATVLLYRRGHRAVAFGLGWFFVALAPVSNLVPMPVPAAERFLYLPLVGIAIAFAAALATLVPRLAARGLRLVAVAGTGLAVLYIALLHARHPHWRSDETLWQQTLTVNPRSCRALSAVGGTLLTRGINTRSAPTLIRSIAFQSAALELCPASTDPMRAAMAYTRRGAARVLIDQRVSAESDLATAMRLAPYYALPVVWRGYLRFLEGNTEAASALLRKAVYELGPPDDLVMEVAAQYADKVDASPPRPARP